MHKLLPILAAFALAGPALATDKSKADKPNVEGEAKLSRALEGLVAGKPVNCIMSRVATGTQVIDGTAIIYEVGSKMYVNRPRGAEQLSSDDVLTTRQISTQLCQNDAVQLIDRYTQQYSGFVALEKFTPYQRPR